MFAYFEFKHMYDTSTESIQHLVFQPLACLCMWSVYHVVDEARRCAGDAFTVTGIPTWNVGKRLKKQFGLHCHFCDMLPMS